MRSGTSSTLIFLLACISKSHAKESLAAYSSNAQSSFVHPSIKTFKTQQPQAIPGLAPRMPINQRWQFQASWSQSPHFRRFLASRSAPEGKPDDGPEPEDTGKESPFTPEELKEMEEATVTAEKSVNGTKVKEYSDGSKGFFFGSASDLEETAEDEGLESTPTAQPDDKL